MKRENIVYLQIVAYNIQLILKLLYILQTVRKVNAMQLYRTLSFKV